MVSWGLKSIFALPLPDELRAAGHSQFLTNLSLMVTLLHLSASLVLGRPNNYLFLVSLILETIVASIYWVLKIVAANLILPEDAFIPLRIDLTIHLFPIVWLLMDLLLNQTQPIRVRKPVAAGLCFVLTLAYYIHLKLLIKPPAVYPYPFLNISPAATNAIFAAVGLVAFGIYLLYAQVHAPPAKHK